MTQLKKICPKCNVLYDGPQKFCVKCGTPLVNCQVQSNPAPQQGQMNPVQQIPVQQSPAQQNKDADMNNGKKSITVLLIICIVLLWVVLGAAGWFVWQSMQMDRDVDTNTNGHNSSVSVTKVEKTERPKNKKDPVASEEDEEVEETEKPTPTPEPTEGPTPTPGPMGDYILPNSSTVRLTTADLAGLSKDQLRLARNEIYARHGRKFDSEDLQAYFGSKSWYTGTVAASSFSESMLSQIERDNIALIKEMENR